MANEHIYDGQRIVNSTASAKHKARKEVGLRVEGRMSGCFSTELGGVEGGVEGVVLGVSRANLAKSGLAEVGGDRREAPRGRFARTGVVGGRGDTCHERGRGSVGESALEATAAC